MNRMSAVAFRSDGAAQQLQRAHGVIRVVLRRRAERTVLADLFQEGCLKARFPRPYGDAAMEVVTINSSGGIAGGDSLTTEVSADAGACVSVAAQTAERFYRARPLDAPASVCTTLHLAEDAALEWLPQEAILFDGSALRRVLDVSIGQGSRFLGLEMLVFGRALMGEQVRQARLSDTIRIRRDGKLVLHDAIRLNGDVNSVLSRPAAARGAHAIATLILAAPDAADWLDRLRNALADGPAEAGASCWNGLLMARLVAADGACLRRAAVAALQSLRPGRDLPRVWRC